MPAKLLALAMQAGLAFVAWWMMQPEHEKQRIQAALWKELENFAMRGAMNASDLAAYAEKKYKQAVTV